VWICGCTACVWLHGVDREGWLLQSSSAFFFLRPFPFSSFLLIPYYSFFFFLFPSAFLFRVLPFSSVFSSFFLILFYSVFFFFLFLPFSSSLLFRDLLPSSFSFFYLLPFYSLFLIFFLLPSYSSFFLPVISSSSISILSFCSCARARAVP
jgi:hypothetical protein